MEQPKEEIKKEEPTKETEMKPKQCCWENCNKPVGVFLSLPAIQIVENQIQRIGESIVKMPFCRYHQLIAASGLCQALRDQKDPTKWNLYAPTEIVTVVETTVAAMVFSGQFQSMNDVKNKAENMIKTKENVKDENKGTSSKDKKE